MSEIDKIILEVEERYQEEMRKQEEAANEKALADEMKAEAIKKERAAKAALKELEVARNHAQKAQESYNAFKEATGEKVTTDEVVTKENVEKTVTGSDVEVKEDNKNSGFTKGLVIGATAVALIATGAWALSRDSKTGDIRAAKLFSKNTEEPANTDEVELVENPGFRYDYDNNVVVVESQVDPAAVYAYDYEANSDNDTQYVDANGNPIPVVTEAGQVITNPIINGNIPANAEYVELTTTRFEALVAQLIQKYESIGLQVSREDIIKYVMIRNIDKLRQDNNELIAQIVGTQDIFEFISDSWHVRDAIRNYNLLYFDKYHTTEGFLSAADGIFDEVQKARAQELERRIFEMALYYQNESKYNELAYTLMRDLDNPLNPISQLEAGVSYGMQSIDMYMVRTTFGTKKNESGLNQVNADLIKYFVSFPEDDDEHSDNALVNGNVSNIIRLLSECQVKTRTK